GVNPGGASPQLRVRSGGSLVSLRETLLGGGAGRGLVSRSETSPVLSREAPAARLFRFACFASRNVARRRCWARARFAKRNIAGIEQRGCCGSLVSLRETLLGGGAGRGLVSRSETSPCVLGGDWRRGLFREAKHRRFVLGVGEGLFVSLRETSPVLS